jgi:Fe-S cluster biogenesis protein NfuA
MRDQVAKELENIRPALQADGGDVELVDVSDDGIVQVKLIGACSGCPMSQITLSQGIERQLKARIPSLKQVVAVPFGSFR